MATHRTHGLMHSLQVLVKTLVEVLQTRIEILAIDLEEDRRQTIGMVVKTLLSVFCFGLAMLLGTCLLIALAWDTYRLWALGGFAMAYLLIGACIALSVKRQMCAARHPFSASIAELNKDWAFLQADRPAS